MIRSLKIRRFRGFENAAMDDFTRLSIVVGPNGSGKSSVLEAIAIAAAPNPMITLGQTVMGRISTLHGAKWVFYRGLASQGLTSAEVSVVLHDDVKVNRILQWLMIGPDHANREAADAANRLERRGQVGPFEAILVKVSLDGGSDGNKETIFGFTVFGGPFNVYEPVLTAPDIIDRELQYLSGLRIATPELWLDLEESYSQEVRRGQKYKDRIVEILARVLPGVRDIELLKDNGHTRLFITYDDRSIPVTLSGDGVTVFLKTAFQLTGEPGSTVLIEEPETHQHPGLMRWTARAIVEAVRSGVQVILTTHSLELIDLLNSELSEAEIGDDDLVSVFKVQLTEGTLKYHREVGREVVDVRNRLGEDLR